jgi:hypothetical protein
MLLHLLVLLALLQMVTTPRAVINAREIIFRLSVPQRLRLAPAPSLPPQSRRLRGASAPRVQPAPGLSGPSAPAPDIRGFGQSVFGCAPENLPNLSAEQRSHCHGLTRPDDTLLVEPASHVKDPQRRAAEMRTKNTPGRIPCTMIMEAPAPYGGKAPAPAVDPICVIGGLLNGFGPLNGLPK